MATPNPVSGYAIKYDSTVVGDTSGGFMNSDDRTIKIKKDTSVSPAFYNWFMANTTKIPKLSSVLNDNSWADIATAADLSIGQNYWSIGDTKQVHLSGTAGGKTWNNDYWVYIIGFDHNSAKEGIGIAFQGFKTAQTGGIDICLAGDSYASFGTTGFVINQSQTNVGGWNGSYAYKTIMPQIKAILPADLQVVIRNTTLYTDNTGNKATAASAVTANNNAVYYLAEYEVRGTNFDANTNEVAQQAQYAYYAEGNSRLKYRSDSTDDPSRWWLRSPNRNGTYSFCSIDHESSATADATGSFGSAPCFKV